jgi:hypothetical protein
MKPHRTQIISLITTILIVGGFVLVPSEVHAQQNSTFQFTTPVAQPNNPFNPLVQGGTQSGQTANGSGLSQIQNDINNQLTNIQLNNTGGTANTIANSATPAPANSATAAPPPSKDTSPCSIFNMTGCVNAFLTYIINNVILSVANWFLTLMGVILNGVMILTLNMSAFVGASGGVVDSTWSVIRDLSSIMIIFFLLYTSIEIIIQKTDSKVQHMIIMVVVAGVLINFSLFFTKVAVDASNLVGLAFYRAIAPSGANINFNQPGSNYISSAFTSGGISNEFMSALKIQSAAYNPNSTGFSTSSAIQIQNTNPLAIIISGLLGAAMMIIAGLSFLAASILFAVRIALLIILMAFSPVYFVGMIIPKVKEKLSDRWWNMLIDQCLILPIYMLFVYVALRVITNPSFQSALNPSGATGGTALFSVSIVGTIMEYIIGLILIIIPLIAAMEYASVGKDWANAAVSKAKSWGKKGLQKGWQETGGRGMSKLANTEGFKNLASNYKVGEWALKGTRGVAQNYNAKLDKQVKSKTEFAQSLGVDQAAMNTAQSHVRNLKQQLATAQATGAPATHISTLKTAIGGGERIVTDIENQRKNAYVNRTNTKSADTMYTKVARKNKVAAAKIQLETIQKTLEHDKDDLKDTRSEIRSLQNAIRNNPATPTAAAGTANAAQLSALNGLLAQQQNQLTSVNNQEAVIDQLKLVK